MNLDYEELESWIVQSFYLYGGEDEHRVECTECGELMLWESDAWDYIEYEDPERPSDVMCNTCLWDDLERVSG